MRHLLFCALILLTGCISSSGPVGSASASLDAPARSSPALHSVNERIPDTPVTLRLTDGRRYREARFVVVGPERTTFTLLRKGPQSVETVTVERIERRMGGGRSAGAKIGATPGLLLMGLSALAMADGDSPEESFGAAFALLGLAGTAAGAAFGSVVGHAVAPGEIEVLYQGPVARYLDAPVSDL